MPWEPTAVKAVQGHKDWVIERIGNRAICQEIYSLDDDFDIQKLDRGDRPRFNSDPETSHMFTTFPRIVYHSTDFRGCSDIIKNGLVVGGFPRKTGRSQLLHCDAVLDRQHEEASGNASWAADLFSLRYGTHDPRRRSTVSN